MLQYGEKGEICNLDIGTHKENMATVKCPRLSGFYWLRAGSGEKVFCFRKTGSLPGFLCLCVWGRALRGRQSLGLLLYFLGIRSPPFHCRPIWKRNAQHDDRGLSSCWGRPEVDLGNVFEWRPVGVPLKPERWTEEMRACLHKREGDCTLCSQNSLCAWTAQTHACMSDSTHGMPRVAFPVLGDTDGCRDLEKESDNRNGRTWGRHTERKTGKAPRKEVSINKAVSHTHEHEHGPNHDRACPLALKWASGSQTFPFSGGLAGYLWSVCVLVMIAAGGCDYCSQTRRSRKRPKSP